MKDFDFYRYYPTEFQDLLEQKYETDNYVGQGNPNSSILIIGKECSIERGCNKDCKECDEEYREKRCKADYKAFLDNLKIWRKKAPIKNNWFDKDHWPWEDYHPRYPYYGQLMLPDNKGNLENTNRGTSPTWVAIQRFINYFLPECQRVQARQQLNFYDYCFMTELSCNCMPKSDRPNEETKESIKKRLSPGGILTHPFFRKFPVIILYIYHYFDWYRDINIIQAFEGETKYNYKGIIVSEEVYAQYDEETKKRIPLYRANNDFKKGEFINVHISEDGTQILIHTNHFLDVYQPRSDVWMEELADTVKPFLGNI